MIKIILAGNLGTYFLKQKRKSDPFPRALTSPQSSVDIHSTQTVSTPTTIVPHITNNDKRQRFTLFLFV